MKRIYQTLNLSEVQRQALDNPCPNCGGKLSVIGDLADFDHNLIAHSENDNPCGYVMNYNNDWDYINDQEIINK